MKKTYKEKAHQLAGLNFFDLVTFTKREEALPSITLQMYGNFNKNDTQMCKYFTNNCIKRQDKGLLNA